jgi:hypothetical protein
MPYHQTITRGHGAANVRPSQLMPCIMEAVATMRGPSGRAPATPPHRDGLALIPGDHPAR